jgi:death-on-curing protein
VAEPIRLDLETLHLLHEQQLARFGGRAGLIDPGVAAFAINACPGRAADGGEEHLAETAAGYLVGFARAPAFADGNLRLGMAAALVFLRANGRPLHVAPDELYRLALAAGDEHAPLSREEVAAWLRARLACPEPASRGSLSPGAAAPAATRAR